MCKTPLFCTFFVFTSGMKRIILLLAALALLTACGTSRRVSAADGTPSWEGRTTADILVQVLLNGVEATLPLPMAAPGSFYRWEDIREYCR